LFLHLGFLDYSGLFAGGILLMIQTQILSGLRPQTVFVF